MATSALILGIETSCDETAAAVVGDGCTVLSNVVASQIDLHALYGGVVPEIAARVHAEKITAIIRQALVAAQVTLEDIAAIAVTYAPGLVGALMTGVEAAKGLALVTGKPLIAVHHVRGHLYSPFLCVQGAGIRDQGAGSRDQGLGAGEQEEEERGEGRGEREESAGESQPSVANLQSAIRNPKSIIANPQSAIRNPKSVIVNPQSAFAWQYPYIGLAISGGHTSLALVESPLQMTAIGRTRDDAAGEAFDKVAKLLGLGYPGGPVIDRLAAEGDAGRFELPRPMIHSHDLDFSFSGLKTAVRLKIEAGAKEQKAGLDEKFVRDLCAGFQAAAIDVLLGKAAAAAKKFSISRVAIVGGVACNRGLRRATSRLERAGYGVIMPPPVYCGDNAAMIAGLGYHLFKAGCLANLSLTARATQGL